MLVVQMVDKFRRYHTGGPSANTRRLREPDSHTLRRFAFGNLALVISSCIERAGTSARFFHSEMSYIVVQTFVFVLDASASDECCVLPTTSCVPEADRPIQCLVEPAQRAQPAFVALSQFAHGINPEDFVTIHK